LITKADGTKFENPKVGIFGLMLLELPYKFYQYWLNTSDVDAEKYIKILLFYLKKIIEVLTEKHKEGHTRLLQKRLAEEITVMVHSADDLENAIKASNIRKFYSDDLKQLDQATFLDVFDGVPQAEISRNEIEAESILLTF
jgi:tyrosyl-tRNA synthetase